MSQRFTLQGLVNPSEDVAERHGRGPYMVLGIDYKGEEDLEEGIRGRVATHLHVCVENGSVHKLPVAEFTRY